MKTPIKSHIEWKIESDFRFDHGICIYAVDKTQGTGGIRLVAKNLEARDAELIVHLYESQRTK